MRVHKGVSCTVTHHGSWPTGDVWVNVSKDQIEEQDGVCMVRVAGPDLVSFVAEQVRAERIRQLEQQADDRQLLLGQLPLDV